MATMNRTTAGPRSPTMPRPTAMRLADTEYQRFLDTLRGLRPADWTQPTECPGWDVRAMATHALGMAEMAASIRENSRQVKAARQRGGVFIDALTGLQVEERAGMSPAEILRRFAAVAPKATRGRRRTPGLIRRRPLPDAQIVGGREEVWTIGYLIDVILTRDPWMHRIDITHATGAPHTVTAEHDGVIVDDVVTEWADRHGQPFTLRLSGLAGGSWSRGVGGPQLELDAIEFCRTLSGRSPAEGLMSTEIPF